MKTLSSHHSHSVLACLLNHTPVTRMGIDRRNASKFSTPIRLLLTRNIFFHNNNTFTLYTAFNNQSSQPTLPILDLILLKYSLCHFIFFYDIVVVLLSLIKLFFQELDCSTFVSNFNLVGVKMCCEKT